MSTTLPGSRIVRRISYWPHWSIITLVVVIVLLVGARIALPYIIKSQVNRRLAAIPGYAGHVERIHVALWRGAYSLGDLAIYKINGAARDPFFLAKDIDFSVAWRELFHRKVVADIKVDRAEINFVAAGTHEASQKDVDRRWQDVVKDIFPLEITFLEVTRSAVTYKDLTRVPHVDVFIKNMHLLAKGLRNRAGEEGGEFPADILVEGDSLGGGRLRLFVMAEPLADQPHFHLSLKLDNVNLPDLNDSLKAVANVDVGRGTFRLVAEMAGRDGGFQGYVKPFFEDLDFHNLEDKHKGVFDRVWEHIVSGLAWLVKNKSRDQVATRIPFEGRFGDSKVGLWTTIRNLFRHGFVRAFNPVVEGSVHADNVLPSGASANGKDVGATKNDAPPKKDAKSKGEASPKDAKPKNDAPPQDVKSVPSR